MKNTLVLLLSLVSLSALADSQVSQNSLDRMAVEFFAPKTANKTLQSFARAQPQHHDPRCDDGGRAPNGRCADVACRLLGQYGCDSISEVEQVGQLCRGNDGRCIEVVCQKLGQYGCDSLSEMQQAGEMCRGTFRTDCIEVSCNRLGQYGCDSLSEVSRVSRSCQGVMGSCVDSICTKLGQYGCDSIDEIERVAQSCRGN